MVYTILLVISSTMFLLNVGLTVFLVRWYISIKSRIEDLELAAIRDMMEQSQNKDRFKSDYEFFYGNGMLARDAFKSACKINGVKP